MMSALYRLNDGKTLDGLRDYWVEELAAEKLKGLYSTINVKTVQHKFDGGTKEMRSRQITLTRAGMSAVPAYVRAFLTELFMPKTAKVLYEESGIRTALVGEYVMDASDLTDERRKLAMEQLEMAYIRCMRFKIIISDDCNHIEVEGEESSAIAGVREVGAVVRAVPLLIAQGAAHVVGKTCTLF